MKSLATATVLALLVFGLFLWPASAETDPVADPAATKEKTELTDEEKTIYALGLAMARSLHNLSLSEAELRILFDGMADSALQRPTTVQIHEYGRKLPRFMKDRSKATVARETAASQPFMAAEAARPGAVTTDSGLIFIPVQEGEGPSPKATDTVVVHYHGTLRDGTVFDSSVERGEPAVFGLNRVIPGWTEGLQRMKVGGKARLVCPAKLAYGDEGSPPKIYGGAALAFDVELIGIEGGGQ